MIREIGREVVAELLELVKRGGVRPECRNGRFEKAPCPAIEGLFTPSNDALTVGASVRMALIRGFRVAMRSR